MKYFVTIWLAVVAFNCLIDATPLPEDRAKTPKEVQKINKWLGVDKNSDILKDILEVANALTKIEDNADEIDTLGTEVANDTDTLTAEVNANADNIWHNTGEIIANAGDISDNADHINFIKAVIQSIHGGDTTTKVTGEPFGTTIDTTPDPTTTEPTTTVQTTTDEPTTTVVTSTQLTTTGGSDCTIDGFEPDNNGNCFKVGDTKLNWAKALKACKALGSAILATVPNAVANIFIKGKLNGNSWIGGYDLTKEGTWKWINGDTWSFVNWKNSNDINNKDEDCAYMASSNGKWQDEACNKKMHYVCMEK